MEWFIILIVASAIWQAIQHVMEKKSQAAKQPGGVGSRPGMASSSGSTGGNAAGSGRSRVDEAMARRREQLEELRRRRQTGGESLRTGAQQTSRSQSAASSQRSAVSSRSSSLLDPQPVPARTAPAPRREIKISADAGEMRRDREREDRARIESKRQSIPQRTAPPKRKVVDLDAELAAVKQQRPALRSGAAARALVEQQEQEASDLADKVYAAGAPGLLIASLHDRRALRRAFVLKMILQPPVSMSGSGRQ